MTRFFTYDETIREHHLFNPRVYIDDVNKRAGAALYLEGLGVEQSRDKAMELYRLAAALGSEEAQRQLAILGD